MEFVFLLHNALLEGNKKGPHCQFGGYPAETDGFFAFTVKSFYEK
jgi:hypothetical protein